MQNKTFLFFLTVGAGLAMFLILTRTWIIVSQHQNPMSASVIEMPVSKIEYHSKAAMASMFWVGEEATNANDFIQNKASYWDSDWMNHFGGVDTPECRNGYLPCGFTPKENPFYVALPYGERESDGSDKTKESAMAVPWFDVWKKNGGELLKNRWVEIRANGRICYAQWEDVGPNGEDDFDFVFGKALHPKNTFGVKAGIDLSPAVTTCLGLKDNARVNWKFVESDDVPVGPWSAIVTKQ